MRKIKLLLLILILSNCQPIKKGNIETQNSISTQKWIKAQSFTVVTPENWRPVKHHGYVGYTPLQKGNNQFNNMVSVFQYQLKEKPSFKEFVQNQTKQNNDALNITTQESFTEENLLGDVYIHKLESTWNGNTYKKYIMYFEYKGEYYNSNYSSLKHSYESHFKEAMSILKSIKFK